MQSAKKNIHVVPEINVPTKKNVFRQTRYHNDEDIISVNLNGVEGKVLNFSRTGISFSLPVTGKTLAQGEAVEGVVVCCGDIKLFEGNIILKNVYKEHEGFRTYGAAFSSCLLLVEGLESAKNVIDCENKLTDIKVNCESADPGFCQSVLALSTALRQIKSVCQREEDRWKDLPLDLKNEAEHIFLPNMSRKVRDVFVYFNVKISKQVDIEKIPENSIYHRLFEEEIYPYFKDANIVRRAVEKPLGYAGDYEMMNQIYRTGYEGPSLFGRILHNYITNENSGDSVRFRRPYFINHYKNMVETKKNIKVLSVASGPAVEVQEILKSWDQEMLNRVSITLFDLDRQALEHAQARLLQLMRDLGKTVEISLVNSSVKSFLVNKIEMNETFDLIYSGGLFDYLDNQVATVLTEKFFSMLNPGGKLVIGNFTSGNLTKAFLHLLTKWTLIHRTEAEIVNWAKNVKNAKIHVDYDDLKMNAFIVLEANENR